MKKLTNTIRAIWQDESAQGATEYILLLVVVVGIAMIFGPKIKGIVTEKMTELDGSIKGFAPDK
jgi:Flp pilus assembly pilin Flp